MKPYKRTEQEEIIREYIYQYIEKHPNCSIYDIFKNNTLWLKSPRTFYKYANEMIKEKMIYDNKKEGKKKRLTVYKNV